jgi:thioredoxin reductase
MIEHTGQRFGLRPKLLAAETAYGSAPVLNWLVGEEGIAPHIPVTENSARDYGSFSRADFRYDEDDDAYICPANNVLKTSGDDLRLYRGTTSCPLKLRCCLKEPVRKIPRSIYDRCSSPRATRRKRTRMTLLSYMLLPAANAATGSPFRERKRKAPPDLGTIRPSNLWRAMNVDVLIVGAGPAGSSAALVLARSRRSVLLCDDGKPRNAASEAIHGLLTHEGQSPAAFKAASEKALLPYKTITRVSERVTKLSGHEGQFKFKTASGAEGGARKVLLATGVVDKLPDIPGIADYYGKSVHHCLYCDGYEYRDQKLAAYGEPQKGSNLARVMRLWSRDVTLCTDGMELDSDLHDRLTDDGIAFKEATIASLKGADGQLEGIYFVDGTSIACTALFFSTGCTPSSDLGQQLGCEGDEKGGLAVSNSCETSVVGVFAAGDASRDVLQIAVAMGEGSRAAVEINKALLRADGLCD